MTSSRLHSLAILGLSLVVFALTIGAATLGAHRSSLYAEPGRLESAVSRR